MSAHAKNRSNPKIGTKAIKSLIDRSEITIDPSTSAGWGPYQCLLTNSQRALNSFMDNGYLSCSTFLMVSLHIAQLMLQASRSLSASRDASHHEDVMRELIKLEYGRSTSWLDAALPKSRWKENSASFKLLIRQYHHATLQAIPLLPYCLLLPRFMPLVGVV